MLFRSGLTNSCVGFSESVSGVWFPQLNKSWISYPLVVEVDVDRARGTIIPACYPPAVDSAVVAFVSFPIDSAGLGLAVLSLVHVGRDPAANQATFSAQGASKFVHSVDGRRAALGRGVFSFDPETGEYALERVINVPGRSPQCSYFSPSGRYLYVSDVHSDTTWPPTTTIQLYQVDLDDATVPPVPLFGPGESAESYLSMALGPDCRLYLSGDGYVGVINYPDLPGTACDFQSQRHRMPNSPGSREGLRLGPYAGSLPDLVNQVTFGAVGTGPRSCQWPRVVPTGDTVCAGRCATLTAERFNDVRTWQWSMPGGMPAAWDGPQPPCIEYAEPGTYSVRLITTNLWGADTSWTSVVVHPRPAVSAGGDRALCSADDVTLTATGAETYRWWTPGRRDTTTGSTRLIRAADVTDSLTVVVEGRTAFGCTASDTVHIRRGRLVATTRPDTTICRGASVTLVAQGGTEYTWWPAVGLDRTDAAMVVATPQTTTTYFVEVSQGTCRDTARVTVTVEPPPQAQVSGDTSICLGGAATLAATDGTGITGDAGYTWWPATGLDRTDAATVVAAPQTTTTYFVEVRRGQCRDTARLTVTVQPGPQAQVSGDTSICAGGTATLVASGGDTYAWWPATGLDRTDAATVVATPQTTTTYFVEVARATCRDTASVTVSIVQPERVLLRHGSAAGAVGTTVETDLVVEAGTAVEVRIDNPHPLALLEAIDGRAVAPSPPSNSIDLGLLDAGLHTLRWRLFLAAPTERTISPEAVAAPCQEVVAVAGTLAIDGCAITRRIVSLGAHATFDVDVVGRAVAVTMTPGTANHAPTGTAEVFDMAGRAIATTAVHPSTTAMLPVPHAGVYIVRVHNGGTVVDVPVVVE